MAITAACFGSATAIAAFADAPPLPEQADAQAATADAEFIAGVFTSRDGLRIPYRLLAPTQPDSGQRYPLVLVLHGSGAIGTDNHSQLGAFALGWAQPDMRVRYPSYVLVPQFPARSANYGEDQATGLASSHATPALSAALALVDDIVAKRPVDTRRIYVTGFSMGASATWNALLLKPRTFAGAIPISGIAPATDNAHALAATPIWVLHGDADTENPIDSDRAMAKAIREAGSSQLKMREYPGLGHRIADDVPSGRWWRDWLFAQRLADPAR